MTLPTSRAGGTRLTRRRPNVRADLLLALRLARGVRADRRLVFGRVRDFLHFYRFGWPVFNVADFCLVVGSVLLIVQLSIE